MSLARDEVASFTITLFEKNCQNFDSGSESNEALFSGKNLKLLIVEKKSFPTVYNMPMFGVVCSTSHFSRQFVNCQFDYCLVLRAELIGTWNQKMIPPTESFQHHEHNGNIRNLKRASVRNHVFWSHLSRFLWNCYNLWSDAPFWKPNISLESCWRVKYNFEFRSLFWLTGKILTFWTILPQVSEFWNLSLGADVNARRTPLGSYEM